VSAAAVIGAQLPGGAQRVQTGRTASVLGFGAKGDGRTDDTEAINAAIASERHVLFPGGRTYLHDGTDLGALGRPGLQLTGEPGAVIKKLPDGTFNNTNRAHLFFDASSTGGSDGIRIRGIEFDLSRDSATPGDTVSALFLARTNDVRIEDCRVRDGIEEGFKLYKCRDVLVRNVQVAHVRNNGVQCHAPGPGEGYTGSRPNQGWANIRVVGCIFTDIDDGKAGTGDGEGVTFNSTDAAVVSRGALVTGCAITDCIRGVWSECNTDGAVMADLRVVGNQIVRPMSHGIGIVGVDGARVEGNLIRNAGALGSASSDKVGILLSGNARPRPRSRRVTCVGNAIYDDRAVPLMEHGIAIRRTDDSQILDNLVRGATVSDYGWDRSDTRNVTLR